MIPLLASLLIGLGVLALVTFAVIVIWWLDYLTEGDSDHLWPHS